MMNAPNSIIDAAFQGGFPDTLYDYLQVGDGIVVKCAAFNRRGTLLAGGCSKGRVVIWDFDTRLITRELVVEDCVSAIMSISWSKYGHRLLASAADKSLILWDVAENKIIARTRLPQAALQVCLHPRSSTPSVCLVCPLSSSPMILHLLKETTKALPVSLGSDAAVPPLKITAACFNKYGDLVYVGNSIGEILIVDHERMEILGAISIPGSSFIKNIAFSRNGQYLLTNSDDRTIRIYDNLLPVKEALEALDKLHQESDETEKLEVVGRQCLSLSSEIQDSESKVQWRALCFSGNGEWVVAGLSSMTKHKLYIWDRTGSVVKILEGPKESSLLDIAWHPVKPVVVSVSLTGFVYIWVKEFDENWSAYDPSYKELDENEEYVEREDEFDIPDEVPSPVKVDEDEIIVDITTVDKDTNFSDSDMSQGEIQYLRHAPIPEERDEKDVGESRLSEESGEAHLTSNDHSSIPLQEESAAPPARRERRPTSKFWDFYM